MGKTIQIIFLMLLAQLSYGQVISGKLTQEIQDTITFTPYIDHVDKKCAEINDYIYKQKELIRFDTFTLPIHFTIAFGDSIPITQPAYFELLPLEEQDSTLQENLTVVAMTVKQKLLKIVFMYYKGMTHEHYFEDQQLILSTQTCIQPFVMMGLCGGLYNHYRNYFRSGQYFHTNIEGNLPPCSCGLNRIVKSDVWDEWIKN